MHWCDEGSEIFMPSENEVTFIKLREFGNWVRIVGNFNSDRTAKLLITLQLKE